MVKTMKMTIQDHSIPPPSIHYHVRPCTPMKHRCLPTVQASSGGLRRTKMLTRSIPATLLRCSREMSMSSPRVGPRTSCWVPGPIVGRVPGSPQGLSLTHHLNGNLHGILEQTNNQASIFFSLVLVIFHVIV